jgi:ABC-type antimicrobial peptide transport system permease subunit
VIGAHVTRESTMTTPEQTFEIIGIARNSAYADLREEQMPVVYFADAQSTAPAFARILVRSTLPPAAVTGAITGVLTQIDPRVTVAYSVVASDIRDSLTRERMLAVVSGGFGALAGALTIVGLYGLVAYTVARRTTEIGVRMALGATARDVARLLLKETGLLLAMGMAAGIVLALAAGPAAASLLFQIKPYDPIALGGAAAALAVVALAACVVPTRRATRIEPIVALRTE